MITARLGAQARIALAAGLATALAATALSAVFADGGWLPQVWGVVAVVTVARLSALRLRVPGLAAPLASLVVVGYLTLLFGHGSATLGVLPGPATWQVWSALRRSAVEDIQRLAAPVPAHQGLVLLAVAGVGLVAVVVDLLAVGARRPALAGLPLIALFAVPAAVVPGGVGWLPFVLAGAGYLTLLLAEGRDRVGRWGHRPAGPAGQDGLDTSPLARLGRRLGAAALGVAVVVPAALPGLHGGLFGTGGDGAIGQGGGGHSSITTYNPITDLKGQLDQPKATELLTVTSSEAEPGYLRMTSLDRFDGETWSSSPLSAPTSQRVARGLPTPAGLAPTTPSRTESAKVQARQLSVPWLPVTYPARRVTVAGDWRYDEASRTIFSTHTDTRDLSYRVTSALPAPQPELLRSDQPLEPAAQRYLTLPPDISAEVAAITRQVTAAARTRYEKAVALQAFFRGPTFHYDLSVPQGNSSDALLNFLQVRHGYCEQFASAMALMARLAGIPARVAIGFTPGRQLGRGTWSVTTHDAHAWPELYFPGAGWLQFEPTPTGDGRAVTPAYSVVPDGTVEDAAGGAAAAAAAGQSGAARTGGPIPDGTTSQADFGGRGGLAPPAHRSYTEPAMILLAVLVAMALAAPFAGRAMLARRRWSHAHEPAARARAAWSQVLDDALDVGVVPSGAQSPRTAAATIARDADLAPDGRAALQRLAHAVERARYARSMPPVGDLRADVASVRRNMLAVAPRWVRRRAVLAPPSTLRRAGSTVGYRLGEAAATTERVRARVRSRVRRSVRNPG